MISPESNYVGVLHNPQTHEIDVLMGKGVKMLLECLELYLSIYAASLHQVSSLKHSRLLLISSLHLSNMTKTKSSRREGMKNDV